MNPLARFLCFWSGVDNSLLAQCPHHERQKYASLGALVLLTGTFAFMASGYAFFTVFESVRIAVVLGFLWALVILNLDRLLLSTFPKCDTFVRQLFHATPRLALALMIGITIAHPLMLRLFEPEIIREIKREISAARAENRARAQETLAKAKNGLLESEVVAKRYVVRNQEVEANKRCAVELTRRRDEYLCEADGTCGTRIRGCGSSCKQKQSAYLQQERDCNDLGNKVSQADTALKDAERALFQSNNRIEAPFRERERELDQNYQEELLRLDSVRGASFLTRSEALATIVDGRPKAASTCLAVAVLFILVEVVSVFIKIISPVDSADKLAMAIRDIFVSRINGLAARLSTPLAPPPTIQEEQVPPSRSEAERSASFWRLFAVICLTLTTAGMMRLCRASLEESIAAATLFATITPQAVQHLERRSRA